MTLRMRKKAFFVVVDILVGRRCRRRCCRLLGSSILFCFWWGLAGFFGDVVGDCRRRCRPLNRRICLRRLRCLYRGVSGGDLWYLIKALLLFFSLRHRHFVFAVVLLLKLLKLFWHFCCCVW